MEDITIFIMNHISSEQVNKITVYKEVSEFAEIGKIYKMHYNTVIDILVTL